MTKDELQVGIPSLSLAIVLLLIWTQPFNWWHFEADISLNKIMAFGILGLFIAGFFVLFLPSRVDRLILFYLTLAATIVIVSLW